VAFVLGIVLLALVALLVVGAVTGLVQVRSCCGVADRAATCG
jgi:hypothetical protein